MAYNKKISRSTRLKRALPIIGGLVIIVVLVIIGLELTNTTHIFHKAPLVKVAVIKTTAPSTKVKSSSAGTKTSAAASSVSATTLATNSSSAGSKDTATGGSSASTATLIAPGGDFVSSHTPNIGDTEVSVCNTTPGATCTITFTMGGTTRSLSTETTDSNGSASWTWTVDNNSSSFAPGTWQITVTAALNGQTKIVTDSRPLEISS